jgi:outer membrane protein assembly factor BamB
MELAMKRNLARSIAFACCLSAFLPVAPSPAENWSSFRGPSGSGVVTGSGLPIEWTAEKQIRWKIRLPGTGWSQPVVWGDRVFVTTAQSDQQSRPDPNNWGPGKGIAGLLSHLSGRGVGGKPPDVQYRWQLLCLDAKTGNVLWERMIREGRPTIPIHTNNTYATETPAADGERVIAYLGMLGAWCYDHAGNLLWKRDLEAYPTQFDWGTGSSPVLFGDHVFIQCDNERASFIAALDKRTGDDVWRRDREERSNWSTPYIWKNELRTELVTTGGNRIRSYDPTTGKVFWEMQGSGRTSSTPVGDEQSLIVDSYDRLMGRSGTLAAIRPGASGDISLGEQETSNEYVAWSTQLSGQRVASPLLYRGCLYVAEQRSGIIHCLDAKTGQEHYSKRMPGAAGFTASPLASSGKVYFLDQNGTTTIVEAGAELKIASSSVLNEMCWASPAVVGDNLLVRTVDHLYCIGQ